jgi:hypothetical protein
MDTRLAQGSSGPSADVCRSQLRRAVACIGRQPRGAALHRVLDRTFVRPAPTQEAAAEVLGLPFSTYRRHLAAAVDNLVDLLWAVEIGEVVLLDDAGLPVSSD